MQTVDYASAVRLSHLGTVLVQYLHINILLTAFQQCVFQDKIVWRPFTHKHTAVFICYKYSVSQSVTNLLKNERCARREHTPTRT